MVDPFTLETRVVEDGFRELTADQLEAIRQHHGLPPLPVVRLVSTGIVHTVYALGDGMVLRVPRDIPEGIADALTESVAAPVAYRGGVRTPA